MRIRTSRLFLLPALLLVLLAAPAYADPVTLTFDQPGSSGFHTSYTEQGFNFSGKMILFGDLENNSSQAATPNTIRIDFGGGTFDFLGADLLFSLGTNPTLGAANFFLGSNGAQLVFGQHNGFIDPQGTFTGITWLEWTHYGCSGEPGPCPAAMDNFRFNTRPETVPTPEPATLLLFGSGLLGAVKAAGKRRKT